MAILFTDLVGSTAMYERLGDAAAYGLVRRHFDLLRTAISAHEGRIVKTVGDAVMASFDHPKDAVRAGLACIAALRTLRGSDGGASGLRLKVGVHTGPCLAIEANGSTDYFGRTVNVAARVESLARPDELVVSWAVLADEGAAAAIDAAVVAGASLERDRRQVKGVADEVDVVRLAPPEQS
jgi:class 3 adenylate cyclase